MPRVGTRRVDTAKRGLVLGTFIKVLDGYVIDKEEFSLDLAMPIPSKRYTTLAIAEDEAPDPKKKAHPPQPPLPQKKEGRGKGFKPPNPITNLPKDPKDKGESTYL